MSEYKSILFNCLLWMIALLKYPFCWKFASFAEIQGWCFHAALNAVSFTCYLKKTFPSYLECVRMFAIFLCDVVIQ